MMDFQGMTPQDAFIAGMQQAMQITASQGRNGDSELAHVNPEEKMMLEQRGGSGTINPNTGMVEYFAGGPSSGGAASGGVGEGDDGNGGGNSDQSGSSGNPDRGYGSGPAPSKGFGSEKGGTSSNPKSGKTTSAVDERSFGEKAVDGIAAAMGLDKAKSAVDGPVSRDDVFGGFMGALGMAPGIGSLMGLSRGLQAAGLDSDPDFSGMDETGQSANDSQILSQNGQQQAAPAVQSQFPWSRSSSQPSAPASLNFDPAMTPLQQRSAIATGATNADSGQYRDPAIMEFYRNLATHSLTDGKNRPLSGQSPLPIELQFLTQQGAQPGNSTESFLRALQSL